MIKCLLLIIVICCILYLLYLLYNTVETFIAPSSNDDILLRKCFDKNSIDTFKQYYDNANVIKIKDSLVFSTPNQFIEEIPHITWNGIFLNNLCVDSKLRNKGIGTQLVLKVIEKAKNDGKDHIILQVAKTNLQATKLYETMGFIKYMEGADETGEPAIIYILFL